MARPTMSKTIYLQQLGRGMRKSEGKKFLMVFDFIDNTNMFNMSLSVHRMFNIKNYRPLEFVLGPKSLRKLEDDLLRKNKKPDVYLDFPLYIKDYEEIDIINWRDDIKDMISQNEFIRMVSIQRETIKKYADEFNWPLINPANMKDEFIKMIDKMDMSYSYKPVLLIGMMKIGEGIIMSENQYYIDCITQEDNLMLKKIMIKEDEQKYEADINYNIDPYATISTVNQIVKVRKLNRAIGENLKLLYNYKCL